jgi:hypothetical protein
LITLKVYIDMPGFNPGSSSSNILSSFLWDEDDDFSETEWLQAASGNPAFDFLKDSEEDIYSENDGKPFYYFNNSVASPYDRNNFINKAGVRRITFIDAKKNYR